MKLKEICNRYGIRYDYDHPKRTRKQLEKYCDYTMVGRNYTIIKEYNKLEVYNNTIFNCGENSIRWKFSYIPTILRHCSGVYKISLGNTIYIGQTNDFERRMYQYRDKTDFTRNNGTYELVRQGAKFEIIELIDGEKERLKRELQYILLYIELGYTVLNCESFTNNKHRGRVSTTKTIKINNTDYYEVIKLLQEKGINYET